MIEEYALRGAGASPNPHDVLAQALNTGAQMTLIAALQAEIVDYATATRVVRDGDDPQLVVWNGASPGRTIQGLVWASTRRVRLK